MSFFIVLPFLCLFNHLLPMETFQTALLATKNPSLRVQLYNATPKEYALSCPNSPSLTLLPQQESFFTLSLPFSWGHYDEPLPHPGETEASFLKRSCPLEPRVACYEQMIRLENPGSFIKLQLTRSLASIRIAQIIAGDKKQLLIQFEKTLQDPLALFPDRIQYCKDISAKEGRASLYLMFTNRTDVPLSVYLRMPPPSIPSLIALESTRYTCSLRKEVGNKSGSQIIKRTGI